MADAGFEQLLQHARLWIDENFEVNARKISWHPEISQLARHVLVGGGKAARPALLFWTYNILSGDAGKPPNYVCDWALALEFVHTYSLVHDDLPAMDNDDFRRGRPTIHRLKSEAAAVLTGDALLTGAFELLSASEATPRQISSAVAELARAGGAKGLISGQWRDMFEGAAQTKEENLLALERTHREKTGALFGAAFYLASLAADVSGLSSGRHESLRQWGIELGLLFQIVDDILDSTASTQELGKTAGKDQLAGKRTYVSLLGFDGARLRAAETRERLEREASLWIPAGRSVSLLLDFFVNRKA